jgi:glutamate-1-semialdehyde aminotransferase
MNFTKSDQYREAIHKLIPGGAHTYSKGDDQFPQQAPAAIDRGKGAWVWDIDGNKFLDCSMGLTSVSLGHAFEPVLERVRQELDKGVNFQRPSIIEKEMAEKFLSLVPGHDMIKFGKNGSLVTTAAVKLARGYTGRKLVAFPGDHPFYSYDDWFIGKTACNKGVPEEISHLSVTFKSCDIDSLKSLFEKYPGQIACVITEPERNFCNKDCACKGEPGKFLKAAIELAHQNGALFIIDEMITGFKTSFPGSITKYNLSPDMATWGKGIANGFSFCALTGKREVMELGGIDKPGAEKLFLVSTTHGGETHTIGAGLATIAFFQEQNVIEQLHRTGKIVIESVKNILKENALQEFIVVSDSEWMPAFVFKNAERNIDAGFRTLFLQEMIKNNVLFQGIFTPSYSHGQDEIVFFIEAFKKSILVYKRALETSYENYLVGSPAKPVFRKYI